MPPSDNLLGRELVELDTAALASFLEDKRVLVTGAGGSIGSELCRQICRVTPELLVLVEQAENPLFQIERELREEYPFAELRDECIRACICDVYDEDRVAELWYQYRPDIVIHAAAHKHVPLMERDPGEAIKNNVLGTINVAEASLANETSSFVLLSTDKAINPTSVMGATKRAAEVFCESLMEHTGMSFRAVRFGNVLYSAGSVIPIFRRQIDNGGPVTVTHPDMQRYFMTIPEAVSLVLTAAAMETEGDIFLLDMGKPVRILDLAKQMIALAGKDIPITFIGVRPGEKMFEELRCDGEELVATSHPKVFAYASRPMDNVRILTLFRHLEAACRSNEITKAVILLKQLVPEYAPAL